jgi:hypothetical protein
MSIGVQEINRKLEDAYGRDVSLNLPTYRIVWSTSQFEKRLGTFEDYTEGGIYLRTVTEIREVHKYPLYPDFWVLEVLTGNNGNPELPAKFSYEPVWVFGSNGKGSRQPLWEPVEILVKAHKFIERKKLTQKDADEQEEIRFQKEKAKFKEMLQNESPWVPGLLHDGEAIVVPHNYKSLDKKESVN